MTDLYKKFEQKSKSVLFLKSNSEDIMKVFVILLAVFTAQTFANSILECFGVKFVF